MGDTLTNALQQAGHNSTVLQGIMNPAQVNPLAGYSSAINLVGGMQGLAAKQGDQLVGQALQQATDPNTGVLDTQKAQRIAAGMGPNAAFAMQGFLKTGSQLRGEQIDQAGHLYGVIGRLGASAANDPSDENMARIRSTGVALGLPPSGLAEIDRIRAMPVDQRSQEAINHTIGAIDALQRLHVMQGAEPASVEQGGQTQFGYRNPVTGEFHPSGPPVVMTLRPDQQFEKITIDDPRKTLPDGSPNPDYGKPKLFTRKETLEMNGYTVLPSGQVIGPGGSGGTGGGPGELGPGRYNVPAPLRNPNAPPAASNPPAPNAPAAPAAPGTIQFGDPNQPQAVPAPPSSSTPTAPYTGGGIGSVFAPPGGAPASSATPARFTSPRSDISPPPNANVAAMLQGMQQGRAAPLAGGAMTAGPGAPTAPTVAATPEPGWGTAPGTYGATAAAPVARPAAAPPPAQRSPFDRPPMGLSSTEQEQMKAAGLSFNAEINAGTNAQTQQALLGNMLVDTKQFLPGPWAETWKNIRARLAPAFGVNETALAGAENFDKGVAQLANAQGAGSDSRMAVNVAANPHGGMSEPGVDLAIRQLQGNSDYIQARAKLAQQWPNADYNGFVASVRELDPRVFQYERMTGPQRIDYLDALSPKDARAFMTAHKWAERKNLIPSR